MLSKLLYSEYNVKVLSLSFELRHIRLTPTDAPLVCSKTVKSNLELEDR